MPRSAGRLDCPSREKFHLHAPIGALVGPYHPCIGSLVIHKKYNEIFGISTKHLMKVFFPHLHTYILWPDTSQA